MAHDLRAVHEVLLTPTIPVPNPYVALTSLLPDQSWFTCIDLANAFFCVPLDESCRHMTSFTYKGQQLRYTSLPQGFALSPGIFNQVLWNALEDCKLPPDVTLIQYVDDLLLVGNYAESCLEATENVLMHLWRQGFVVCKEKLQIAWKQVRFLGRVVSQNAIGLSTSHRVTILHHPKPEKVKDMLSFLGLTGYSRHYIPEYVGHTQALRDMAKVQGMRNLNATLEWTGEGETAFIRFKQLLAQAVDLASPDYMRPFFLDVSETAGTVNGVLFHKKGGERQILMHVSTQLDNMEKRHPTCTQHAAGVAKAIQKTVHLVMGHPITVLTTHSVIAYVNSQAFTLTVLRQQRISKILEAPHITYTREGINMADMMGGGEPHQCEQEVKKQEKVRPDLEGEPIPGAWNLFTDGCGFRGPDGDIKAGYAVVAETQGEVDEFWTVKAERLKGWQSVQRAEVIAAVEALKLAKGKEVNIYTDSAYTVGAAHVELEQWMRARFRTAGNKPIKHEAEMKELAKALQGPEREGKTSPPTRAQTPGTRRSSWDGSRGYSPDAEESGKLVASVPEGDDTDKLTDGMLKRRGGLIKECAGYCNSPDGYAMRVCVQKVCNPQKGHPIGRSLGRPPVNRQSFDSHCPPASAAGSRVVSFPFICSGHHQSSFTGVAYQLSTTSTYVVKALIDSRWAQLLVMFELFVGYAGVGVRRWRLYAHLQNGIMSDDKCPSVSEINLLSP
ncbi:hypothetical protein P4O66_000703 [Electrophorus voltai]|uniref:ribonuclease H n=1 Tax=Electrophorus voltai TaxID=2609070 RepID=A0AAD9DWN5_9TELE|nr:hypothetical protein P4O66_000703 [Electrophorus voltai]